MLQLNIGIKGGLMPTESELSLLNSFDKRIRTEVPKIHLSNMICNCSMRWVNKIGVSWTACRHTDTACKEG